MQRPWISVNFAISADGKISSVARHPSGWTSAADYQRLLDLRKNADALLAGKGTILEDRMTMTVPGKQIQPLRCIVTRNAELPLDHPIFQTPGGEIHVCVTENADTRLPGAVMHPGSLPSFLEELFVNQGIRRLHCEGGGRLVRDLMELGVIDEFHLTIAGHTLFGGRDAPTTTGVPLSFPPNSIQFEITSFEPRPLSGECFVSYRRIR